MKATAFLAAGHRRLSLLITLTAVLSLAAVLTVDGAPQSAESSPKPAAKPASPAAPASQELVKRGEYLVTIGVCNDCHTPFKPGPNGVGPDMSRRLSGHPQDLQMPPAPAASGPWKWSGAATNTAFAGPWGVSYARNLTPDVNTGIGTWTEDIFINTLRTGRHWGVARPILPPMPWQNYRRMTDQDLKAIFAYLRTIPPISNRVPEPVIAPAPGTPAAKSR
jgi:mono/diheme cytochrome c family protein